MEIIFSLGFLFLGYLIGSIPFGLIIVRLTSGKDIRQVESGRTGGTNAMRAAGFWAGFFTAILDFLKSASMVWLARYLISMGVVLSSVWLEVLGPVAAIWGHNHSIFLMERDETGRLKLRGGAGGASATGGVFGLWAPGAIIVIPVGLFILFGIGYASLATMSVGVIAIGIFAYRAWLGLSPWQYIFYGIFVELILMWALRPNIKRLINGTERLVGWRAKQMKIREIHQ